MIVDDGIALEDDAFATHHGAMDEEATAVEEAGGVGEVLLQAVHEFAELLIKVQMRRLALAVEIQVLRDPVPSRGNIIWFQSVGFSLDEADACCFPLFPRRDCSWRG